MLFSVRFCHVNRQQENSTFFTFASNRAVFPQNTRSSPFRKISGSAAKKNIFKFKLVSPKMVNGHIHVFAYKTLTVKLILSNLLSLFDFVYSSMLAKGACSYPNDLVQF